MADAKESAPHVARAVVAAQAKPAAVAARAGAPAAHVARTVARVVSPKAAAPPAKPASHVARAAAGPLLPKVAKTGGKPAAHVARAMAGTLSPKSAAPAAKPAQHVARAMTGTLSPKASAAAPQPAAHVAAAVSAATGHAPRQAAAQPGRLARLAAHLQAAQARLAPAGPAAPAAHVAAASRAGAAVQPMKRAATTKKKPPAKKQKTAPAPTATPPGSAPDEHYSKKFKVIVDTAVSNVNAEIVTANTSQPNFFTYKGTGIPTQPVELTHLGKRALKLSAEDSSLANLAFSTKGLGSVGPEIQFGVVRNRKSGQRQLRISGNSQSYNDKIRAKIPASNRLEDYYRDSLRARHVEQRREELQQNSQHLNAGEIDKVLAESLEIHPDDREAFRGLASQLAGYKVHKKYRATPNRQRSKSARRLAYGSHKDWRIEVATNSTDIHAESAILSETLANADEELEKVRGTKVPCVSCSTFFRHRKVPAAILEHTSGAWLSESSMKQLGFDLKEIEKYLKHIHKVLGPVTLNSYDGANGEIAIKDQTLNLDPASDSEDEEAHTAIDIRQQTTAKGRKLLARIDKFEKQNF